MCVHLSASVSTPQRALITSDMIWCDTAVCDWLNPFHSFQVIAVDKLNGHNLSNIVCRACHAGKDIDVDAILAMEGGIQIT